MTTLDCTHRNSLIIVVKNRKKYTEFNFNNCYVVYIYEMF